MRIERIRAENFKSFEEIDIRPGDVNVVVGPNASGKSNFFSLFRFLRDIAAHGLENAVSMQGGMESLVRFGPSNREVAIGVDISFPWFASTLGNLVIGTLVVADAAFALNLASSDAGRVSVEGQESRFGFEIEPHQENQKKMRAELQFRSGEGRLEAKVAQDFRSESVSITEELPLPLGIEKQIGEWIQLSSELEEHEIHFVSGSPLFPWMGHFVGTLEHQSFLDFEPKLAQRGTPVTGKKDLEEDGSNLALVLNHILRDEERKEKFLRLASDVLGFIEDIDVDRFADNQLLTHLDERFGDGARPIPASMASDGTLSVLALIVALYFDDSDVSFIEEPTRNVHPHLAGRIAQMVEDAGRSKQVFATTHNPQFLAGFDPKDILLVKRGKDGVSRIERASDDERLQAFLENDVGLDEVFVQNILGQ